MKDLFNQLLEEMKDKVMKNLEAVKAFEAEIKKISNTPQNAAMEVYLESRRKKSRQILTNNLDYLELQLKLIQFVDKYRKHDILVQPLPEGKKFIDPLRDYFADTVEGRLPFDKYHPFYTDEAFIDRLLAYYISKEDYRKCEQLTQLRKMLNRQDMLK
jgi:hypothetical protein